MQAMIPVDAQMTITFI